MSHFNNDTKASGQVYIPAWMLVSDNKNSEVVRNKASNTKFLRNTITGISKVFQNEIFNERFAQDRKFLQSIDPRAKLLTFLFFMIFCGLTRSILTLVLLSFAAILYAKLSGIALKSFIKRVWLYIPVLVLIISIPAATSFFIKGKPLIYIYKEIYISLEGLKAIFKMALRIGASFSFGYLLVLTTRWTYLTKSLTVLRVPLLIISILNMTYRYIFILSKIASDMMEARFMRTVGRVKNNSNRMFIANRISYLFVKSSFLSDDIYDSMRCRCFTGEPVYLNSLRLRRIDYLWIINNIFIALILMIGEILL